MHSAALLFALLSVTNGAHGGLANTNAKLATLHCADPRLPSGILDGANGSVDQEVSATPLPVVSVTGTVKPLTLAVAADPRSRELGLMCVTALKPGTGMVFVFPTDSEQEFWMKNTVTPLDMLWIASDGTVRDVFPDVPAATLDMPDDQVARRHGRGRYVIELRSGEAAAAHITPGTHLQLPPLHAAP